MAYNFIMVLCKTTADPPLYKWTIQIVTLFYYLSKSRKLCKIINCKIQNLINSLIKSKDIIHIRHCFNVNAKILTIL